jgi:hypothetical protein
VKLHIPEIVRIINGGMLGDASKVLAYAEFLALKFEQDGNVEAADSIRRALSRLDKQEVIVPMHSGET